MIIGILTQLPCHLQIQQPQPRCTLHGRCLLPERCALYNNNEINHSNSKSPQQTLTLLSTFAFACYLLAIILAIYMPQKTKKTQPALALVPSPSWTLEPPFLASTNAKNTACSPRAIDSDCFGTIAARLMRSG
jgi:hypothetical protein